MSRKNSIVMPTDEEDACINAGIGLDSDNPELNEADFGSLRAASEIVPELASERRVRGPQKATTKRLVSLRLDPDVVMRLKESGPGWQTRVNTILREAVGI
jgi:uncharacterized protein (DUF4415 family)